MDENAAASGPANSGPAVRIYGKEGCPHTRRARDAWPEAEFLDVLANPLLLDEMLRLTGGARRIPVIVRPGAVEIGFKRGS